MSSTMLAVDQLAVDSSVESVETDTDRHRHSYTDTSTSHKPRRAPPQPAR